MPTNARRILRDLTPPVIARTLAGRTAGRTRYVDDCASWDEAVATAGAYSEAAILDRVRSATEAVVSGHAAFERDGVVFDRLEYRWPVVAALMWQAARDGGSLRVLDFGGSLGSSYRQYRGLFGDLDIRWGVVEQPSFVEAGHAFADEVLSFHTSVDACVTAVRPNAILISSVLQYLPDPHVVLSHLGTVGARTLVIDRTPLLDGPTDWPVVQVVPSTIYDASYPAWLLSPHRLVGDLPGWTLVDDYPGIEPEGRTSSGVGFSWRGMTFTRGSG